MDSVKMDNQEFDLNIHTARLLMDEPFLPLSLDALIKTASFMIPTAGVM